ncbi:hypothetical protein [Sphaerothrix gracilis]|uniref:hypothetical protein n=1 Tax=Sphaerothrix gracilis TaxID=3151835 RepID=UPI0031FBD5D4
MTLDLDQQIQTLIQEAPKDGSTGTAVEAIAPALKSLAAQLKHLQYYILQTLDQGWVMTTVANRNQAEVRKNVIYAYPTLQDVALGPQSVKDPQVMGLPVPVTHILFRMLSLRSVDSVIFFENPGSLRRAVEVRRQDIQTILQTQLQQAVQKANSVPPDIA